MKSKLYLLLIFSLLILSSCSPQKTDCSQDIYDCNDFNTHGEAQELYELCGGVENDIHWLDGNKDGEACESLPLIDKKITIGIIVLIILGLIFFGFKIVKKINKLDKKEVIEKIKELSPFEKRWEKGLEFEKYVLSLFPKDKWEIEDYTKDTIKGVDRKINSSVNPDFTMKYKKTGDCFGIECKYRSYLYGINNNPNKGFSIKQRHLNNYKEFNKKSGCEVYLILGVGGSPSKPEKMFKVHLDNAKSFINETSLKNHQFKFDNFIDLKDIDETKKTSTNYHARLNKIKEKYPNAYEPWTKEELSRLVKLYKDKVSINKIADELKRQPSSIRQRLDKFGKL